MLDFRERSRLRRALYAKPTLIFLAIVATGVVHASWSMYQKSKEALVKKEKALSELSELEARQAQLSHDITVLSTERGVEAEIRERFMVAKEGESVMILAEPVEEKVHTVTIVDQNPTMMRRVLGAIGFSN